MLSNMTHYSDFLHTKGSIFFSDFFSNLRTAILEEVKKDGFTERGFYFAGTTVGLFLFSHLPFMSSAWKRSYVQPTFNH